MKKYTIWINITSLLLIFIAMVLTGIHGSWYWLSYAAAFLGVVGVIFAGWNIFLSRKERLHSKSRNLGANAFTGMIVLIAIVALLAFITTRRHYRLDLTGNKLFSMSDQTKQVLKNLKKKITIYSFVKEGQEEAVRDLLDEYAYLSAKVNYEIIDPIKKAPVAKQYGIKNYLETVIICAEKREKIEKPEERELTNAIIKVTKDSTKAVYFLKGHGEKDIEGKDAESYSFAKKELEDENYRVKSFSILAEKSIPSDCSVLIVAGPKSEPLSAEIDTIHTWVEKGNKLFLLLDPETPQSWRKLAAQFGIEAKDQWAIDASGVGQLLGMGPAVPLIQNYEKHPITEKLKQAAFMPVSVPLVASTHDNGYNVKPLFKTSSNSWGESNYRSKEAGFDKGKDLPGPLNLGMISEKVISGKIKLDVVVTGDSDFGSNGYLKAGNRDLFLNIVSWLAEEGDLVSIRPKRMDDRRLTLTPADSKIIMYITVIFLPFIIISLGFVVYFRRKKR